MAGTEKKNLSTRSRFSGVREPARSGGRLRF
jgi:hypothetical protein